MFTIEVAVAETVQYATDSIDCLNELRNIKYRLVPLGYFNLPDVDWECHNSPNNKIYSFFMDFFDEFGLHQFVDFVSQNHILDLILSNDKLLISALEDVGPLATSDNHNQIKSQLQSNQISQSNHNLETTEEEILNS